MRDGWIASTLGEVATLVIGRTPPRNERVYWTDDLTLPFCTIADMNEKWVEPSREGVTPEAIRDAKARRIEAGTLLMSFKLTIGRVGFAAKDLFPNEAIVAISPQENVVSRDYLYLLLGHQDLSQGSGRAVKGATLNSKSLARIPLCLPPLAEQRRIVDLVASVDAYIAGLEKQAEAARTARNAVLHELLTANGDDWTETTLGQVAEWFSGGTPKAGKAEFYEGGTIPWVVIADMAETEIRATAKSITQEGLREIGGRLAPVGSVLISMYATVGRAAFAHLPVATNQAIAWSVPNQAVVLPRFLLFVAQALETTVSAMARGATQKNINREILRNVEFLLPPMDVQRQIVNLVSSMDAVSQATEKAMRDAKNLRSGLLSGLLSGEHKIPESYDKFLGAA